ncbi:MAG: hypothetical protein M1274_02080 [Actinobacteria bacterium]|nr:hypothetical protein [Actinomycetota bacterium]
MLGVALLSSDAFLAGLQIGYRYGFGQAGVNQFLALAFELLQPVLLGHQDSLVLFALFGQAG